MFAAEKIPIPPVSDADSRVAFPTLAHSMQHTPGVNSLVLVDHLEFTRDRGRTSGHVDVEGWIGGDVKRLWFSFDGEKAGGESFEGCVETHYGRSISAWWDVLVGVRQDVWGGAARTALSFGIRGLVPWFIETGAYVDVDAAGDTQLRLSAEYNLLLTNQLILQPDVEVTLLGSDEPSQNLGSGLSSIEAGLRLRYEFTREFAPYVGVVYERKFGETAGLHTLAVEHTSSTTWVAGLRFWF